MSASPIYLGTIEGFAAQILPADTTTQKSLVTAATNGTRVNSIVATSTDTAARDLVVVKTKGGVDYLLGTVSIPANSGNTNALPAVDILASPQLKGVCYDGNGNPYIDLVTGEVLKVNTGTTVTAAKAVNVTGFGASA